MRDSTETANFEEVTPQWAASVLANQATLRNSRKERLNRALRLHVVAAYARQMREGKWRLNGEPIIFAGQRLMNGQHRLHAVVEAGVAVKMLIVRGVDEGVFDSIDQGANRTASDIVGMAGVKSAKLVSSAAHLVMLQERFGSMQKDPTRSFARNEVAAFVLEHRSEMELALAATDEAWAVCGAPALLIALAYLVRHHEKRRTEFFAGLKTGANLTELSPVRHFRERLIAARNSNKIAAAPMTLRAAWGVKAWNAFISDEPMKLLRHNPDHPFPVLLT